jgi:hypothetical protein
MGGQNYDYTEVELEEMRNRAIQAALTELGLTPHSTFDAPDSNGVDVWCRTPNGYRVILSVAVFAPDGAPDGAEV